MLVEIFSINAAVSGTPYGTTWRGELPMEGRPDSAINALLERVYRFLNRVDEGDHERMAEVGYLLPSLSVGDFVTLHLYGTGPQGPITEPRTWRVESAGFSEVTGNRLAYMR